MKEKIEEVLNDETLTTNEERVEALAKGLATVAIPKDKYNELTDRLKKVENEKSILGTEFEDFKKSKMTEEELAKAEKENIENDKKKLLIKSNRLDVERLLEKAGLTEEDYKDDIDTIVSEDTEKSVKLANFFVKSLTAHSEKVKQQTVTNLLNDTPKPVVGDPNAGKVSNVDAYKAKLEEAVKTGNQVDIATYTRMIFEEQKKQAI